MEPIIHYQKIQTQIVRDIAEYLVEHFTYITKFAAMIHLKEHFDYPLSAIVAAYNAIEW